MEFGPEQIDDGFGSFQCGNEEKDKQCAQETSCKNKTQTINRGAIIITRERGRDRGIGTRDTKPRKINGGNRHVISGDRKPGER